MKFINLFEKENRLKRKAYFPDKEFQRIEKNIPKAKKEFQKKVDTKKREYNKTIKSIDKTNSELKDWKNKTYKPTSIRVKSKIATDYSSAKDANERARKKNIDRLENDIEELTKYQKNLESELYELLAILTMF